MKSININDLDQSLYGNIIDVREVDEYNNDHIKGVKNIPFIGLIMNPELFLNKEETYYIMCQAGGRSMMATMQLEAKGYDVVNLEGGFNAYKK